MNEIFYSMIFKRKSFHIFRNIESDKISTKELNLIAEKFKQFTPLIDNIKIELKIVKSEESNSKRGEEYCLLLYSEKKDNYLQNIGYIGEQLDLYLVSQNIGTLWYGIGKTSEMKYKELDFVIMILIKKVPNDKLRECMYKSKRKELTEIWKNNNYLEIANIVRFAPSACNTQPWIVESNEKSLEIYRYKKEGKRGIMPTNLVTYYNKIDIGIFLLFLDVCLNHNNIKYKRELFKDDSIHEKTLFAKYIIN